MTETNDLSNISFILDFQNPNKLPVEAFELMLLLGYRGEALRLAKRLETSDVKVMALKQIALHTRNKEKAKALLFQALDVLGQLDQYSFYGLLNDFIDGIKPDDEELVEKIIAIIKLVKEDSYKSEYFAIVAIWLTENNKIGQGKELLAKTLEEFRTFEDKFHVYLLCFISSGFRKINQIEQAIELLEEAFTMVSTVTDMEWKMERGCDYFFDIGKEFVELEKWGQVREIIDILSDIPGPCSQSESVTLQSLMAIKLAKKGDSEKENAIEMLMDAKQKVNSFPEDFMKDIPLVRITKAFAEIGEEDLAIKTLNELLVLLSSDLTRQLMLLWMLTDVSLTLKQAATTASIVEDSIRFVLTPERINKPSKDSTLLWSVEPLLELGQWQRAKEIANLISDKDKQFRILSLCRIGIWLAKQANSTLTEIRDLTA